MLETNNISITKPPFILTRDMVPIIVSSFDDKNGCLFACPLPKGYRKVIQRKINEIKPISEIITSEINKAAEQIMPPFENILLGYKNRTEDEQMRVLKQMKITKVYIDERGVYGVDAGCDINSGDVYLKSDTSPSILLNFHMLMQPLTDLVEANAAFYCHNIDFYWQALLTREFCIRYFNWLNQFCG